MDDELNELYNILMELFMIPTEERKILDDDSDFYFKEQVLAEWEYHTSNYVSKLKEALNIYFNRKHWWDKIRVKYDKQFHVLTIKQPYIHKIPRYDLKFRLLKEVVVKARRDTRTGGLGVSGCMDLMCIPIMVSRNYYCERMKRRVKDEMGSLKN